MATPRSRGSRSRRRAAALGVLAVLGVGATSLAACGGSDTDVETQVLGVVVEREPSTTESTTPEEQPATTPDAPATTTTEAPPATTTTVVPPVPPTTGTTTTTTTPVASSAPPLPDLSFLTPTTTAAPAPEPVVEPAPAPVETVPPPAPPTREALGAQAEQLVPYAFRQMLPSWTITYLPGRSGVRGLTFPDRDAIEIYVRDGDTAGVIARVLAHEMGHAIDLTFNSEADRQRWRDARGVGPEVPWWPSGTTNDFDTLAGDFAEATAVWLVNADSRSNVGGPLTADQLAVVAELAQG